MSLKSAINSVYYDGFKYTIPEDQTVTSLVQKLSSQLSLIDSTIEIPEFEVRKALDALTNNKATKREIKIVCVSGLSIIESESDKYDLQLLLKNIFSSIKEFGRIIYKSLLIGYLTTSLNNDEMRTLIRDFLHSHKDQIPRRWKNRVSDYSLLEPDVGPKLSVMLLDSKLGSPSELLDRAGLTGVKMGGTVGLEIFKALVHSVSQHLTPHTLNIFKETIQTQNPYLFKNRIDLYTEALIRPYLSECGDNNIKREVLDLVVNTFGDPRTNQATWVAADPELTSNVKHWLADRSFDVLMSVLSASNSSHMWKPRAHFWKYYYDAGVITDVWVAFGEVGTHYAKKMIDSGELKGTGEFGKIIGSVDLEHSMIMLQVGEFTITEWTHSGKVRIFKKGNDRTPKFYSSVYRATLIRDDYGADIALTHAPKTWELQLASLFEYHLGVTPSDSLRHSAKRFKKTFICRDCNTPQHYLFEVGRNQCSSCSRKTL